MTFNQQIVDMENFNLGFDLRAARNTIVALREKVGGEPSKVGTQQNVLAYFLRDAHFDLEICIGNTEYERKRRNAGNDGSPEGRKEGKEMRDEQVANAGTSFLEELKNLRDSTQSARARARWLRKCALVTENEDEEDRADDVVWNLAKTVKELNWAIKAWGSDDN